jgi:hypothetical protein
MTFKPIQRPPQNPNSAVSSSMEEVKAPRTVVNPYLKSSASKATCVMEPTNFPTKPHGWNTVDDVRDVFNKKTNNASPFDFVITSFGPTCGKCPKCGGSVVSKSQQLSKAEDCSHGFCAQIHPRTLDEVCCL